MSELYQWATARAGDDDEAVSRKYRDCVGERAATQRPRSVTATWQILEGDCRDVLRTLPDRSVHTVVTSPPYFGLRDYGNEGQIGLEPTPDEFVQALVAVFREVRRVLRDDGTVWLNLGDSYNAYNGNRGPAAGINAVADQQRNTADRGLTVPALKPKDLIGVPWMVAFALRVDGWYLRSDIVWAKPNPMPESVTDRPTKAHEYLFLLSKRASYFYDADAIREAPSDNPGGAAFYARKGHPMPASADERKDAAGRRDGTSGFATRVPDYSSGRNKRSVWTVATQPFAGAHFATFPPKLIEPCVLAGCPERACSMCGAPWERVVERTEAEPQRKNYAAAEAGAVERHRGLPERAGGFYNDAPRTVGFEPSCSCNADTTAGTVLDPFAGAGTTGLVALRHNRSFIGIELNPEYAEMARRRVRDDAPLLNVPAERMAA